MELKEYLAVFRARTNLFLGIILAALVSGALFYFFQPIKYRAELVLNVTRTGQVKTADYQFDDFYRLQADERFADTVVRWLETERMQNDIRKGAKIADNQIFSLTAKRLSSQMIDVNILASDPGAAEKIALAVSATVNLEAEKLNAWQQKEGWFKVVADHPVTSREIWEWHRVILIALLLGIFGAFWGVLIRHYLE